MSTRDKKITIKALPMRDVWKYGGLAIVIRAGTRESQYEVQWRAAGHIQRNARAALARWRVSRALLRVWTKYYDVHAERYAFTHNAIGATQYHKPWGMGTADLWISPSYEADENLVRIFLNNQGSPKVYENNGREDPRTWEGAKRVRHNLYRYHEDRNFSVGPYRRICGPGKTMESLSTNVFLYAKKYYTVRPFTHPRDKQYESTKMGTSLPGMDGRVEKKITADPYFHIRNASEHGASDVLKVMFKHRDDMRLLGVGLQRMAGSLLEEDEAGGPTEGQKKYLAKALELLRSHPDVEWIQVEASAALASMSSELCIRKVMDREYEDWLEDVVTAMLKVRIVTQVVKEIDTAGRERRGEENVASSMAHLVALHACRILANMACDENNRDRVARHSIASIVHIAKLMPDDPVLACAVSAAIYNFVSRQEKTQEVVIDAGAKRVLEEMLDSLQPADGKAREMLVRALKALEPEGWRGDDHGLQDEGTLLIHI